MPELTMVVPTLNERKNLIPMVEALGRALSGIDYEIVFVDDDSIDGTSEAARQLAQNNPRVRILQRVGRRGLASAVVEGMMASSAPYLGVIDSDMQHDESILAAMVGKLKSEQLDLVIGTRHTSGGSMGEMAPHRKALSRLGQRLSAMVCRTTLSDPMSGFFVLTRQYLNEVVHSLSSTGFKILLDLVASASRPIKIGEVGYTFRPRLHGESKLDIVVSVEYLELIAEKVVRGWIPVSYIMFACVGAFGVLAHVAFVRILLFGGLTIERAQLISSVLAIGVNFLLNNQLTFRSAKLSGKRVLSGMVIFYVACSAGLFLNLGVFEALQQRSAPWYLAAAAGLLAGAVWNYWMSTLFVWQIRRRRRAHRGALESRAAQSRKAAGAVVTRS